MSTQTPTGLGREIVLTLNGPDRRGIVHAVTGAMVGLDLNILDSQQFGDPSTGEFHLRMEASREGAPIDVDTLRHVHDQLIQTVEEVRGIHRDGMAQRRQAEADLARLREDVQKQLAKPASDG